MKRTIHHDIYIGLIMLLFSVGMFVNTYKMPEGSAQFPKIILSLFTFFSLYILAFGIKKTKDLNSSNKNEKSLSFQEVNTPLAIFLIIVAYVTIIKFLGFFIATTMFMIAFMYFYKVKSWKLIILNALGVNLFIYLLFVLQLNVRLPKGLFF